jgi:hypothetical protein
MRLVRRTADQRGCRRSQPQHAGPRAAPKAQPSAADSTAALARCRAHAWAAAVEQLPHISQKDIEAEQLVLPPIPVLGVPSAPGDALQLPGASVRKINDAW